MDVLEAVLLGLVQGAGEFLPVSSSGHLLLLEKLGLGEEDLFFNICLHLGTLLSVLVCMRREVFGLFRRENRKNCCTSLSPASRRSCLRCSSNSSRPP